MGKYKACCGVQDRWERTENTTELVKPQQANEGLSLSAEACVIVIRDETTSCPSEAEDMSSQGKEKLQSSV